MISFIIFPLYLAIASASFLYRLLTLFTDDAFNDARRFSSARHTSRAQHFGKAASNRCGIFAVRPHTSFRHGWRAIAAAEI